MPTPEPGAWMYCADMLAFSSFSGAATAATRSAAPRRCSARGQGGTAAVGGGGGWGGKSRGALPRGHRQSLWRPQAVCGWGSNPRTTMQSQLPTPSSHLLLPGRGGLRQARGLLLPDGATGLHRRGGRHGAGARSLHCGCLLAVPAGRLSVWIAAATQQPIGQGGASRWAGRMWRTGLLRSHAAAAAASRRTARAACAVCAAIATYPRLVSPLKAYLWHPSTARGSEQPGQDASVPSGHPRQELRGCRATESRCSDI